jgi:hypothetical protein
MIGQRLQVARDKSSSCSLAPGVQEGTVDRIGTSSPSNISPWKVSSITFPFLCSPESVCGLKFYVCLACDHRQRCTPTRLVAGAKSCSGATHLHTAYTALLDGFRLRIVLNTSRLFFLENISYGVGRDNLPEAATELTR